jgi:hypothetical protein
MEIIKISVKQTTQDNFVTTIKKMHSQTVSHCIAHMKL